MSIVVSYMKRPTEPSISPSEPEVENRLVNEAINKIKNGEFDGIEIYLPYAKKFLHEHNLDIDEDGFLIDLDTGDYSVPYVFVDELVNEYVKDDNESVFDAFFRPVTDDRVYGWNDKRVHLTDLHAVITTDNGRSHPICDHSFDIAEFHAKLETRHRVIMGWSDLVKKEDLNKNGQWLGIAKESEENLNINCINPDCNYRGCISSWHGDINTSPECPDCNGKWDSDGISVCTICESWYWGTHYEGESIYAEPVCANCGADMEYIERVSRYDNINGFESLVENNKPKYTVIGLDENDEVEYTFEYCETKDDAEDAKELAEDISESSAFEKIESVKIQKRDLDTNVTNYEIE